MSPVLGLTNKTRAGNFTWAGVLVTGADVGLGEHSRSGWGYVGEEGDWKRTSLAKPTGHVFVDNHRLLPDPEMDALQVTDPERRAVMERMEGRLRRFGYSFFAPFVTGWCAPRGRVPSARRVGSCVCRRLSRRSRSLSPHFVPQHARAQPAGAPPPRRVRHRPRPLAGPAPDLRGGARCGGRRPAAGVPHLGAGRRAGGAAHRRAREARAEHPDPGVAEPRGGGGQERGEPAARDEADREGAGGAGQGAAARDGVGGGGGWESEGRGGCEGGEGGGGWGREGERGRRSSSGAGGEARCCWGRGWWGRGRSPSGCRRRRRRRRKCSRWQCRACRWGRCTACSSRSRNGGCDW